MNRLPSWLKQEIPGFLARKTANNIRKLGVDTVCQEASCPNIGDCFRRKRAAFMILGHLCTRNCSFCNVQKYDNLKPEIDRNEPQRIARAVSFLGLKYAVITSVTRDDLDDGGASQFAKVIELLRDVDRSIKAEVLIPDFKGNIESLKKVVYAHPFILAHNLETIRRLYSIIRPEADYERSLSLLKKVKELDRGLITKSSLMLGLGETEDELIIALKDLRESGCNIVTLGQYLAPSPGHYPVREFIPPEQFQKYALIARGLGFKKVLSGAKVRSSYYAEELLSHQ